jgi:adenosyl cobinamide kinase/adenosyl cobinamide phosphate guanylyltransferase
MLNFVENLLENERGPMNDQDLTKTDYDPDRSLVLIECLSHFLTNFLQNLASCQTSFRTNLTEKIQKFVITFHSHLVLYQPNFILSYQ